MKLTIRLAGMAGLAALVIMGGIGCASSSQVEQPATTSYMRSQVGTPNELSPLAPVGAHNLHKDGSQWVCELNGQTMVYNNAASKWEPKK
jgi:uncharacterized lipoprotein